MNLKQLLIILCVMTVSMTTNAQSKADINKKVETLLAKMTLDEKIGQMNQYNGFYDITGPAPAAGDAKNKYENVKNGMCGSMLNVKGVDQVRKMQKLAVEGSRLGIPLIFAYDVIHGHKTLSPIPLAEAASWDLEAIENSARVAAKEATAIGLNMTFAPMVDIGRDARWGRVMEGAGEDPYLGSLIGAARVRGFQGDDLSANNTMAACAKHFAAYGFAEGGRDYNASDLGTSTLFNVVLPPFKACLDANVRTFMNSFNTLNGVPATGDKWLQRDILKGEWGFDGFVVSDWGSIGEMMAHGHAKDLPHAAELAANAGSDMDMESYAYVKHLKKLVADGNVKEEVIDDAVRRILRVKFELGLFDEAAAREMAKKSIVLLKNQKSLLPLKRTGQKIAVIGALADDKTSPLGSWRLGSDDGTAVSVVEGFKNKKIEISYAKGVNVFTSQPSFLHEMKVNETDKSGMEEAINLAKNSDVVVMVLGEHGFQSGEGRSRTKLDLPGLQQELLEKVHAVNDNIVLVLMNGRPLAIDWANENIPAIVEAWHLGTETGNALTDVLFGDYNPSGKLPMTFPKTVGQVPIYYNHLSSGRPGPIEMVFWMHYIDETVKPLYPFGHGLSYTTFGYSGLKVESMAGGAFKVSATVKNTGKVAGEEVAQLYIQDKVASVARPVKELKGFQKFSLNPGESKIVEFTLTDKELGFYNNQGKYIVEPGVFEVMVGTNSQKGLMGRFEKK